MKTQKNSIDTRFVSRSPGWMCLASLVVLFLLASPPSLLAQPSEFDFGDAPDPLYPTYLANNGAYHLGLNPTVIIGTVIDLEPDGQPTTNADGDDVNPPAQPDDEDGVQFPTALISGVPSTVNVTISGATNQAWLQGWIDFDGNGSWVEPGEQIIANFPVFNGMYTLPFLVGQLPSSSNTYARFRVSSTPSLPFTGPANDGEVEDHEIKIDPLKWVQEPDLTETGADVGHEYELADDFLCTNTGPITDIHIWGSIYGDDMGYPASALTNMSFILRFYSDIPDPDPPNPGTWSMPGQLLWVQFFAPGQFQAGLCSQVPQGEWWHSPQSNFWQPQADFNCYQFDFYPNPGEEFYQTNDNIYWLSVEAFVGTNQFEFGWKSSTNYWNDDAVWWNNDSGGWVHLLYGDGHPFAQYPYPENSLDLAFALSTEEVEDRDWGDLPDIYNTLAANNGANHLIVPNVLMGPMIDAEPDGQPDSQALGDDNDLVYPPPNDDEDGVVFNTLFIPGQTVQFDVTVSVPGHLDVWLDADSSGNWNAGDLMFSGGVAAGLNPLNFLVPSTTSSGTNYVRFRYNTGGALPPTGSAQDGEVEDYQVNIEGLDWGDAPDPSYPTLNANMGPDHLIVPGILLGANIDSESDGQPTSIADGDDIAGIPDDEDGVVFNPLNPVPGQPGQVNVTVVGTGYLNAWFDWARDGSWAQPGDQVFTNLSLSTGVHALNFVSPTNTPWGTNLFTRFRFSTMSNLTYTGSAPDGEVEDHQIKTREAPDHELGDAPDSSNNLGANMTAYPKGGPAGVVARYPTVYGSGSPAPVGPIHWLPLNQAYLGAAVSREEEADVNPDEDFINNILPPTDQPDRDARDDTFAGLGLLSLPHCRPTALTYTATWATPPTTQMFVNVWFDWNRDGDWSDKIICPDGSVADEWAVQDHPLPPPLGPTPALITDTTPPFVAWHPSLSPTSIWMRISVAEQPWSSLATIAGGEGPTNGYLYGETEDYYITAYEVVDENDFGDAPPSYPTLLPGGARHYFISGYNLGTNIDWELNGLPNLSATGDDTNNVADEDGVIFTTSLVRGSNACVDVYVTSGVTNNYLDAWVDFNKNNLWESPAEQVFTSQLLSVGNNPGLCFLVPTNAVLGTNYARFRLSTLGGLPPGGQAVNGEVEDYVVKICQRQLATNVTITNITVNTVAATNQTITLQWNSEVGISYQMQQATTLSNSPVAWSNVGPPVLGPANTLVLTNANSIFERYYRVCVPYTCP